MAWTDAPTPSWARPASVGGPASTSGAPPADPAPPMGYTGHVNLQDMLRDLLAAFYQAYLEDATEPRRRRMAALLQQADRHGLLGPCAVEGLAELFSSLTREFAVDPQRFAAFYHFFFFVARDRGHRNLADATAVEGWRFLLGGGRFALLEPWCAFVRERREGGKGVSEDTWCQVLDFAHSCDDARGGGGGCLDAYDPHGAWPVLVDEFVDHVRRRGKGGAEGADDGAEGADESPPGTSAKTGAKNQDGVEAVPGEPLSDEVIASAPGWPTRVLYSAWRQQPGVGGGAALLQVDEHVSPFPAEPDGGFAMPGLPLGAREEPDLRMTRYSLGSGARLVMGDSSLVDLLDDEQDGADKVHALAVVEPRVCQSVALENICQAFVRE